MPIIIDGDIRQIDRSDFKKIDYEVMGHAYKAHSELGPHFDELIYSNYLAAELLRANLQVRREVEIQISHQSFQKKFYIDLLVENAVPYELKTVDAFHPKHDAQLLQYLYLSRLKDGKLLNFRKDSLQGRFVSATISNEQRYEFTITKQDTRKNKIADLIENTLHNLLSDWGTLLSTALYADALVALIPGAQHSKVNLFYNNITLGSTTVATLHPTGFLHISAVKNQKSQQYTYIKRLLSMTSLEECYWINFNNQHIQLLHIRKFS